MTTLTKLLLAAMVCVLASCGPKQLNIENEANIKKLKIDSLEKRHAYFDKKYMDHVKLCAEYQAQSYGCWVPKCHDPLVKRWKLSIDSITYYSDQMAKTNSEIWSIKY